MTALHRHWTIWAGALVIAAAPVQLAAAAPVPAPSATDYNQLVTRLQRLERDMRDVEAATFRKPPGDKVDAPPPQDTPPAVEAPPPVDLNPLMRRIDELEEGLGRVTGQMEVLGHQVDELTQKADRLQKQLDLQAAARAKAEADAQTAPQTPAQDTDQIASADKPPVSAADSGLAKPPGVLGTIPAGSTLPKPDNSDPRKQFDAAMALLARARYDEASDAFRAFVDAHPAEDRAPDALYWSGDIAYSTKKDYPAAARDFAELLKKYPKAQRAPDGMLKLSLALFEMGQTREACAAAAALPAKYPDASAATLTQARSVRDEKKCK